VPATYYLTIALLDHQPTQTELLGQIRAVGAAVLTRQVITPEERLSLQTAESMAKLHNQKTRALVAKAVESEPGLKASIGVAMQQAGAEHDAAVRLLRDQVLRPGELNHAPKAYFASLTQAIDAEYRLMNAGLTELRALLEQRIARAERLLLLLLGGVTGAIVFTLWISLATVRQANRAVKATLAAAHALANGDLKHPIQVDSRDEFGAIADALGESMASLATMVRDIKQVINTVNTASAEIALGTEDLSTRTEEQASSLEQTSASMDELSRAVRLNSEHARQANEMALQACEVARNGGDTVHEVVESMQSINHSSRRIADIIGVIDSIAFQTNILALNASVEAARAGEQGRGFAVVASEVRNLAQRSAQAAQEIKSLITDSVKQIETGARQADQAGQTVHGIVDAISRVTTLMAEISQASASQAQGITQVVEAVTHMDGMTQQNASLVEETAHASRSLEIQANQVAQAMERFQL
jgi:methyl-accepting chemotaxis protein